MHLWTAAMIIDICRSSYIADGVPYWINQSHGYGVHKKTCLIQQQEQPGANDITSTKFSVQIKETLSITCANTAKRTRRACTDGMLNHGEQTFLSSGYAVLHPFL